MPSVRFLAYSFCWNSSRLIPEVGRGKKKKKKAKSLCASCDFVTSWLLCCLGFYQGHVFPPHPVVGGVAGSTCLDLTMECVVQLTVEHLRGNLMKAMFQLLSVCKQVCPFLLNISIAPVEHSYDIKKEREIESFF